MNCPVCSNQLQQTTVSDVTVDVCKGGCGGLWFDNYEIKKFDEPNESAGRELLETEKNPDIDIDLSKRLNCPKCGDIVMARHYFSVKRNVLIDECPGCGGIWLDAGELAGIRELFETEQQRHDAAHAYFKELFGADLAAAEAEKQAKLRKAQQFANMFRFICPTYYIPGKQDWGAF